MPSIITIALSTNIPIAKMNEASDTRCIDPLTAPNIRNEPMTMTIRLNPMMTPLLNPIVIIRMTTTIMTDSIRLMKKVVRESVTRSG